MPDEKHFSRLDGLLKQKNKYLSLIKRAYINLADVKQFLTEIGDSIFTLRKKIAKGAMKQPTEELVIKFDSRLATAQKNMDYVMWKNIRMRNYIESLLKDRTQFKKQMEALLEHLNEGKKIMVDLIEQSLTAFEHRDEYMKKLRLLREEYEARQTSDYQEAQDYYKKVNQFILCYKFLTIKGQKRVMRELEERMEDQYLGELLETAITKRDYSMILRTLYALFGQTDVDSLCAYFKKQEGENFALFNYVNEVHCETEFLIEQTKTMRRKCTEDLTKKEQTLLQHTAGLKELELELKYETERTHTMEEKHVFMSMFVSHSLKELTGLFNNSFNTSPFYSLLGETEVNYLNVEMFLNIFERRILYLIKTFNSLKTNNSEHAKYTLM